MYNKKTIILSSAATFLLVTAITISTLNETCISVMADSNIKPELPNIEEKSEKDQTVITEVYPKSRYLLSDYERNVVESIVMGEAEGESYEGQVLVAQCLLNACLKEDKAPSEIRELYGYAGWNECPSESVKKAVKAVFDEGYTITDEPILFFYNSEYVYSSFHESQRYILTEGNHRFFAAN